ncbi:MAG TPA: alpha/beta hydrolase [Mycobacteriales bacterium]|nr:alpha/beta hydrolase [Mycobacteriales bacterium]
MTESRYSRKGVKVDGGLLMVGEWAADSPPVVAIHGVSSTHLLWQWTAAAAPGVRLVAPDLRGRGSSVDVAGPYGLTRHRDDVLTVMDSMGIDKAVVAGMSMGGFVATALADFAPDRVSELLLVDGGPPMTPPTAPAAAETSSEEPLADRLERTDRTYARVEDYKRTFLGGVGASLDPDDALLTDYLRYDLVGQAPELEVRLAPDAVRQDAADVFFGCPVEEWMAGLTMPVTLLYAEWSIGAGSDPAYPEDVVDGWRARLPQLQARLVPGVDHAGSAMSATGAKEIAVELQRAVGR